MKTEKTSHGWLIDPETTSEENALAFLVNALRKTYCLNITGGVMQSDLPLANPLQLEESYSTSQAQV